MLKKSIARYFGFPLQDIVRGTNIVEKLNFLRKSQYWDEDRIYEYQLTKLKDLFNYSRKNVPYYEELFRKSKLTHNDFKTLKDIDKIPILTKDILREKQTQLLSREFKKFNVRFSPTGGTTGSPVLVGFDTNNRSFTWGSYYRWYDWMGIDYFDNIATLWGSKKVLHSSFKDSLFLKVQNFLQNEFVFNSFELDNKNMHLIAKKIQKSKTVLLKGYLSAVIQFTRFVQKNNYKFNSIRAISTTTETLLPHNRNYIEKVFDVPVYNQYGCGEVSAIAYECNFHNGLHINQEHVICEILDSNYNKILNKPGKIVVSGLNNYVMPFFRYENGDMATLSNNKCECGLAHPLLNSIDGRSIDTVVLKNGNQVHGVFFTDILYELNIFNDKIQRFQIYQEFPGSIEFRIETLTKIDLRIKNLIKNSFLNFLNDIKIIEMNNLPLSKSGKFRYIINNIKK